MKYIVKKLLFWGFWLAIFLVAVLSVWAMTIEMPDFASFSQRKISQSTKIYDKTGKIILYDVHGQIKRTIIPYEQIPRHVKNATVAIEDDNFYNHFGISPLAIIRAFLINIISGDIKQGGSTITQQLVKNTLLTHEKTLSRKIKEVILSLKVEQKFSKDEILNFYLNEIPYGSSNYGIEAASQSFFGKYARDLSLAEAAYLAALPKAPTFYSPYGNHPELLEQRKNLVLKRMAELGFISNQEAEQAKKEEVVFINRGEGGLKAPHFVIYVREYLEQKYGKEVVEQGGLKVITTLDLEMQKTAEDLTKQYVEDEQEKFNVFNAGLVAINPKNGHVLAMVGSKDWFADPLPEGCTPGLNCKFEPHVNVTTYAKGRQPGSAFKPFVYATALEKGYTDQTVVFDLQTEFNPNCNLDINQQEEPEPEQEQDQATACYHPQNYDKIFRGPVTFREALAQSINVPSVKALYLAGLQESLQTAKSMGITTLKDINRYGLTLVLGGGEVRLLEMVGAYSAFANDGIKNEIIFIKRIEDANGKVLEENKSFGERVISEQTARTINGMLSDNNARAPAFGQNSYLYFPDQQVAAKTGTTNDYKDAWVIGYTPNIAVGVWFGNNNNESMEKRVAGFIAAPLWNAFLKEILPDLPKEEFIPPEKQNITKPVLNGVWRGSRIYLIDKISGKRATDFTPAEYIEQKVITQIHNILYWVNKDNPKGPFPQNPQQDPQFNSWEFTVRKWAAEQNIKEQTEADIPKEFDNIHIPENKPRAIFKNLPPNTIKPDGLLAFSLSITSKYPVRQIDVNFGSRFLGTIKSRPYSFSFGLSELQLEAGQYDLSINIYDKVGNKTTLREKINIKD